MQLQTQTQPTIAPQSNLAGRSAVDLEFARLLESGDIHAAIEYRLTILTNTIREQRAESEPPKLAALALAGIGGLAGIGLTSPALLALGALGGIAYLGSVGLNALQSGSIHPLPLTTISLGEAVRRLSDSSNTGGSRGSTIGQIPDSVLLPAGYLSPIERAEFVILSVNPASRFALWQLMARKFADGTLGNYFCLQAERPVVQQRIREIEGLLGAPERHSVTSVGIAVGPSHQVAPARSYDALSAMHDELDHAEGIQRQATAPQPRQQPKSHPVRQQPKPAQRFGERTALPEYWRYTINDFVANIDSLEIDVFSLNPQSKKFSQALLCRAYSSLKQWCQNFGQAHCDPEKAGPKLVYAVFGLQRNAAGYVEALAWASEFARVFFETGEFMPAPKPELRPDSTPAPISDLTRSVPTSTLVSAPTPAPAPEPVSVPPVSDIWDSDDDDADDLFGNAFGSQK
jgi:hypothetical protein